MGGGGSYYDRDVTRSSRRSSSGFSDKAAAATSKTRSLTKDINPKGRKMVCPVRSPLIYAFDITGSMGRLPRIIWDKMPMIVGQLIAREYLTEFQMCFGAVGDIRYDSAPIQVGDFCSPKECDKWLEKLFFEGGGGGNDVESYDLMAWYFANMVDFSRAETPFFLFTGDEGLYPQLEADTIRKWVDPEYSGPTVQVGDIFEDLLAKFGGNVFRIHRNYPRMNDHVIGQWRDVLGERRVVELGTDLAIGDVTLGLYAMVSGARTLGQYIEDMNTRPLDLAADAKFEPQSPERIAEVEKSLEPLQDFEPTSVPSSEPNPRLDMLLDS